MDIVSHLKFLENYDKMTEVMIMNFNDTIKKYYLEGNYNCSETMIHAANEYYGLNLDLESMKMFSGFGTGMFVGSACGALIGSVAVLSKLVTQTKAHDQLDTLRPSIQKCVRNFKENLGALDCKDIQPVHRTKEYRCLNTCLLAGQALEQTIKELDLENREK